MKIHKAYSIPRKQEHRSWDWVEDGCTDWSWSRREELLDSLYLGDLGATDHIDLRSWESVGEGVAGGVGVDWGWAATGRAGRSRRSTSPVTSTERRLGCWPERSSSGSRSHVIIVSKESSEPTSGCCRWAGGCEPGATSRWPWIIKSRRPSSSCSINRLNCLNIISLQVRVNIVSIGIRCLLIERSHDRLLISRMLQP